MIKVLTGSQMRDIDKKAIEELKIPGIVLMENAGRSVYEQVIEILDNNNDSVLIICGKGNNGGDGFAAARHLVEDGILTVVISLFLVEELSGDALVNHNILKNFTEILYFDEMEPQLFHDFISQSSVIVDAILGTGINSKVNGKAKDAIEAINEFSEGLIVSIDIPSGIDANTGKILGNGVIADYTATFVAPKIGSVIYPGAEFAGEVIINTIGIPENLLEDYNINLITQDDAAVRLPIRSDDSHKGTFGSVFNIAGSFGMTGAAYMSAYSSLAVGAGYSMLAAPSSIIPIISPMAPELVYVPLKETNNQTVAQEAVAEALDKSSRCNSFLIGPGLGTDPSTVNFVLELTQELTNRGLCTVFDADGLNCLSKCNDFILPVNSTITPHPMELSRLIKIPVDQIMDDKIKAARDAAASLNTIVVLKGARTIIAEPNGKIYINTTGNNGLAKAGSGDILAGMIAGFIAQGISFVDAAILGVYLHGLAADIAIKELTEYSLLASKLINYIPNAIKYITE